MIDLGHDLARLGDRLALDDDGLVDEVLDRIGEPSRRPRSSTWLVAASVVLAVIAVALVVPSSRQAIDDLPVGVVVGEFVGSLDSDVITKVLGGGSDIQRVDVNGLPGLWIDGSPHELLIRDVDGAMVTRRFAGNTLLWQDGDVIRRIEGTATLDEALELAASVD